MKLYLQCPTGISGDMFLASMVDLGLDINALQDIFVQAGIQVQIKAIKYKQKGIVGSKVQIVSSPRQPKRDLSSLQDLVDNLQVSLKIKQRSLQAINRLAEVEAEVHGVSKQEIHFHEIGAVDTLIDIVGAFWAVEQLKVDEVICSDLPWFQGQVNIHHGLLPLPAPATLKLLEGKPVYPTEFNQEIITPTGALLIDQLVNHFSSGPQGIIQKTGHGCGSYDLGDIPNRLCAFLVEQEMIQRQKIWVLESNLDHLTGEEIGGLFDPLFKAGALDVIYMPGIMKKNRSGGLLQVMCKAEDLFLIQKTLFHHSLTLGVRQKEMERVVLSRNQDMISSSLGEIKAKEIELDGEKYSRPEYEALKELADKTGRSVVQLRYLLGSKK